MTTSGQEDVAAMPPAEKVVATNTEHSLGDLFSELTQDMGELVRQEIALAKAETKETFSNATTSIVYLVLGGVLAYAGLIVLLFAVAAALSLVMDLWLAHIIVGAAIIICGAILLISGRNMLKNLSLTPEKTIETLKNDARWAKEQVS